MGQPYSGVRGAGHDATARLADGRDAAAHTQAYVSACGRLGYRLPDLTGYDGQVTDWYDGEDGLDLRMLDDDCARLGTAVSAAEEALRVQRAQLGELAAGWRGSGADAAAAFLRGHLEAGALLAGGLRGVLRACETLRDELWRCVDAKVAAAIDVDDRVAPQRPAWLAAVAAGDAEVIERQILLYVDNDVRGDWLAAMRAARAAVTGAYRAATAAVQPVGMVFAIPGVLGARDEPAAAPAVVVSRGWPPVDAVGGAPGTPSSAGGLSAPQPPAGTPVVPAAAVPPAAAPADPPAVPAADLAAAPPATSLVDPLGAAAGWPADAGLPGLGGLGGGLPGLPGLGGLGGLGGLIPQLVDALGGGGIPDGDVVSELPADASDDGEVPGDVGSDEPDADDDTATDDTENIDDTEPEPQAEEPVVEAVADEPDDDAAAAPGDQTGVPQGEPAAPASSGNTEKSPCEIAADELPQVGQ